MNKLGFGYLRLPKNGDELDYDTLNLITDAYIEKGGRYFDTAFSYLGGKSEESIGRCLSSRHPRDSYMLATKLAGYDVKSYEGCWRQFETQRTRCGVEYFDVYMLHWLNKKNYDLAEKYNEFAFLQELKEKGLAKKTGFSYHDTADLLDEILTKHPEVDYVLLQINYLDWESDAIQSRLCYETCVKHGKKVIVMEPVKGGRLADIPQEARDILAEIDADASPAQLAIRFAQSLENVEIVLSGMNSMQQIEENLADVQPLTAEEMAVMQKAVAVIKGATAVDCTACGYCLKHCPKNIAIPEYFKLYNEYMRNPADDWKITPVYDNFTLKSGKASDCISCRRCENNCPQKLPITQHLKSIAQAFEKTE
ncbi:MAG: aldo/keto reductase [Oscillospiraceae bacterium]|nr:aldo/keto reductase [Oscillospiraceae bacterium]